MLQSELAMAFFLALQLTGRFAKLFTQTIADAFSRQADPTVKNINNDLVSHLAHD